MNFIDSDSGVTSVSSNSDYRPQEIGIVLKPEKVSISVSVKEPPTVIYKIIIQRIETYLMISVNQIRRLKRIPKNETDSGRTLGLPLHVPSASVVPVGDPGVPDPEPAGELELEDFISRG